MNFYLHKSPCSDLTGSCTDGMVKYTKASGVLALPASEPIPGILIQAGLGDPVVPMIAAEALARAFDALILPNNSRTMFGVPTLQATNDNATWDGPHVTVTEL